MSKNILFRVDSSSFIGTGHIMRDLVLAKRYEKKGDKVSFASLNLEGNISQKVVENGFGLEILKSNETSELISLIKKKNIQLLVIDNYSINWKFEKEIKDKTSVKILSFDDTYEIHHCDILLNHNISADKKRYKNLVPKECKVRCGSKYTLLRDEFYKEKRKKKKDRKYKTVFVAIGGSDHSNINIDILKVLKRFKNLHVNLVTTSANRNLESLKKYCENKDWINLYINSKKIASLMRKSDFSIVTPSVTVNEVYFMNLPFIAVKTADNQEDMYSFLTKKRHFTLKKFDKIKLKKSITKLLKSKKWIKK